MKKNKNLEMKIYELLGVKIFRKIAFSLASIISLPKKRKMTKEELLDLRETINNLVEYESNQQTIKDKKFNKYRQLLFALKYKFNFDSSSKLSYLNNKDIILDKSYYSNYIGDNL